MVLAQLNLADPSVNPAAKFDTIGGFANVAIALLMGGSGLVFFAMMLMAAYTFMTAAGDAEKVKQAQKMFKFSIFGFVIILTSFLIIKVIEFILKIKILP